MLKAAETDQKESVDKLAKKLQEQFSGSNYAAYGGLFPGQSKGVDKGDIAAAKDILKKTSGLAPDKELSHVAKIRLVKLMLASGEYEQGLKVINDDRSIRRL